MEYKQFIEDILKQYENTFDIVKEEDLQKITSKFYGTIIEKGNSWLNNAFQSFLWYFRYIKQEPITVNDIKSFLEGFNE